MKPNKDEEPEWLRCRVCIEQMFGGPRCYVHNPTPEQRAGMPPVKRPVSRVLDEEEPAS